MLQFVVHKFCLAKVRKTAQKNLGKARKSGAEGEKVALLLLNLTFHKSVGRYTFLAAKVQKVSERNKAIGL